MYLINISILSLCTLPDLNTIPCPPDYIGNIEFSEAEVFEALSCLDPNKAMGIDMISPKILKYCAAALVTVHHLFTLTNNHLHLTGKHILLYQCSNLVIKQLLSHFSPLHHEFLIYNKVIDHIVKFISPYQFGFLHGRSCTKQLFLNKSIASKTQCDTIYLDFKKAFPQTNLLLNLVLEAMSGDGFTVTFLAAFWK